MSSTVAMVGRSMPLSFLFFLYCPLASFLISSSSLRCTVVSDGEERRVRGLALGEVGDN
ncbi:hypothetical protein NC653_037898 [Populus alba x Populus x berolinensis]|uniref:Uncharacterized protein n=1 Tax=Populus alba x Populus x berolinensis TaxID=444605 RepID=A0AAD6LGX1_9ROSI|nr:hypothetical protein NC653_037898 [Populus alba x Populus x berolinensis]